ncbi:uncharacterized protein DEA37_0003016 [Paragonimus westermani]|uniref:CCHC-type domain-containing protein n=1 Tax=Paragonimus westermani TaxID=34504 RepID=A0A5J4NFD8_9TREM|nr:uncharacterized protein DEA37_0003016 [Paragonimus westermani]
MQKLKRLAKDCGFKAVNASEYHDETIRDAFIRGMLSNKVRQRLMEEDDRDLAKAFTQATALETAESQSLSYKHPHVPYNESCALHSPVSIDPSDSGKPDSNLAATIPKCFFCGYNKHSRSKCPAREALCRNCRKVGHFQRFCKFDPSDKRVVFCTKPQLFTACTAAFPTSPSKAAVQITANGISLDAFIDNGSSDSYIRSDIAYRHCWHIYPSNLAISMASTTYTSVTQGHSLVTVDCRGNCDSSVKLFLLPNLCSDVLLGHDFLKHQHILTSFGGSKPPFSLCSLTAAHVEPPTPFGDLSPLCKPSATKSRGLSSPDRKFVESEINHGVIKPDPERFRALRELPPTPDLKSQQRTVGMFVYYYNWISHFSDKIHNLIHKIFPPPDGVKQTFEDFKRELENAAVVTINYKIPLVVETDASDTAIAATLNQDSRPVAFFSRTLNPSERNHSPIEKEAYAIVEALRKWRHYLLGGPVLLKKQQRASKYDPVVEEVELLDCNPQYAHVRLPNGKEQTVSVKHVAPCGEPDELGNSECLADANEIAHEMCPNDEAADSPTPTNYELLKQKQQRLHPYNMRSREA